MILYLYSITVASALVVVFQLGVIIGKAKNEKVRSPFDFIGLVPYGIASVWGVIVIITGGSV